jgi:hypothetical protein
MYNPSRHHDLVAYSPLHLDLFLDNQAYQIPVLVPTKMTNYGHLLFRLQYNLDYFPFKIE